MAWTATVLNSEGDLLLSEGIAGPNGVAYVYTSDISSYLKGRDEAGHRYISVFVIKGTGTIAAGDLTTLFAGSNDGGTTKFVLVSSPGSIPELNTTSVTSAGASFDAAIYPAKAQYFSLLGDSGDDDSDITFTFYVYVPHV